MGNVHSNYCKWHKFEILKKNINMHKLDKSSVKSILHQNIWNCLYFVCLFAHYVYMSGLYLYIVFP